MSRRFSCPSCHHRLVAQPSTGKCPGCGEFNYAWHVVDKNGFIRLLKIKMYINLVISIILLVSTPIFIGVDYSSLTLPHGGKSGLFIVMHAVLYALLHPCLGRFSISAVYFLLFLIFASLTYRYYKQLSVNNYDSHNPLG